MYPLVVGKRTNHPMAKYSKSKKCHKIRSYFSVTNNKNLPKLDNVSELSAYFTIYNHFAFEKVSV